MNQTTNYNLNQWQRHDRVLMDDFNADNAKIDAALAKHDAAITAEASARQTAVAAAEGKISWVKLLDMTTSANAAQVDIDVSKLDLTKYHKMELHLRLPVTSGKGHIRLLCNGETKAYYNGTSGPYEGIANFSISPGYQMPQMAELYLGDGVMSMGRSSYRGDADGKPNIGMSQSTVFLCWPKSVTQLKKLQLKVDEPDTMGKGAKIYLYGLRK